MYVGIGYSSAKFSDGTDTELHMVSKNPGMETKQRRAKDTLMTLSRQHKRAAIQKISSKPNQRVSNAALVLSSKDWENIRDGGSVEK